jgi:hypothetical protein
VRHARGQLLVASGATYARRAALREAGGTFGTFLTAAGPRRGWNFAR